MTGQETGRRPHGRRRGGIPISAAVLAAALVLGIGSDARQRWTATSDRPPAWVVDANRPGAPARLRPDTIPPDRTAPPARLLWLEGRAAHPVPGGAVVVDEDGEVIVMDARLAVGRRTVRTGGRLLEAAAGAPDGGLWVVDAGGTLLRIDSAGAVLSQRQTPYAHPALAADSTGARLWLTRSARRFAFTWDTQPAPIVWAVGLRGIGTPLVPEHVLLTDLANAGHLAVGDGAIYYAPFIRDEILALDSTGDTLWITRRGLPHGTREPRFEIAAGKAVIDYHPVNLGLAVGPDGLLYALSTPGPTTMASRLDVIEPASGRRLRTAVLETALPTLAVDTKGRVYLLDPDRLLRGIPPAERETLPSFDLAGLDGGRITSDGLRGRVALVNVWASWCTPCRDEMPALDSLRRRLADTAFAFVALNEDQDLEAARRFLERGGLDFAVGLGRGRLAARLHYPGLPYTVLLDRDGRIAQRWIGFAGREQIDHIERLVRRELRRTPVVDGTGRAAEHPHHGHGGRT